MQIVCALYSFQNLRFDYSYDRNRSIPSFNLEKAFLLSCALNSSLRGLAKTSSLQAYAGPKSFDEFSILRTCKGLN